MSAALILWTHALAALLFGAMAMAAWRRPGEAGPRTAFLAALVATALWALAVAGIDPRDVSIRVVQSVRDIAWLVFMFALARRGWTRAWALAAVHTTLMLVVATAAFLAIAESVLPAGPAQAALATTRLLFRMMSAAGALVLVHQLYAAAPARGGTRLVALALGLMWGTDLLLFTVAFAGGTELESLMVVRGGVMAAAALLLAAAAGPEAEWTPSLSRPAAARVLAALALAGYVAVAAVLAEVTRVWGGDEHGRALEAGVAFGAAAALLALVSTPWLRAWSRVKLAKHLFRHRYDYRVEWQRFTETLAGGADAAPLEARVVEAMATLLDAPGGVLLVPDGARLSPVQAWRWPDAPGIGESEVLKQRLTTGRIVELDAVRAGTATADEQDAVAGVLRADSDSWLLVPLVHGGTLAGAVLLARPPVERALDWEDLDLLRVAGPQAASHLAEQRAHAALAEARRFDEFHRRFAFILHDLKNLASQQLLVARNAERHAANPDFRADMVATLKDSADRMTALLARLSRHEPMPAEPLGAVDVAALVHRMAAARRAQHTVEVEASAPIWAHVHQQRLEQVLGHLVQNAAEASAPGSPVMLAVTAHQGAVTITVADRGVGMPPQFVRDQLFTPFASSKAGGFGLGAFEARQLVEAMDGTVAVDSRPGEGTTVRVTLVAAPALEAAA